MMFTLRGQPEVGTARRSIGAAPAAPGSMRRRMASGVAWTVAARWSIQGIGLVSTIVLARLLSPADFGLVAMATITVGFVSVLHDAGQDLAVIRHRDPTPEHFDTAWTMSICAGLATTLILAAVAPLAGWYFHAPRVVALMRFLALVPFIEGFTNVGVTADFRRSLQFDKELQYRVVKKLAVFMAALPLAFVLRDYRALAGGIVIGRLIAVVASYRLHPYRPRLRLSTLRDIWSFSAWSQVAAVAQFFAAQADSLIVGRLAGAAQLGAYQIGVDLGTLPVTAVIAPSSRALFPVYATALDRPVRLVQSYLDVLSFTTIIALSAGVGIALVARDLVTVLLGTKWSAAVDLVRWLAVGGGVLSVVGSAAVVVNVTGHARLNALRNWAFVAVLVPAAVIAGWRWGSEGVAAARAIIVVLFAPVMFSMLMRVLPITPGAIIGRLWRPVIAVLSMAAIVSFSGAGGIGPAAARLFSDAGLGAVTFVAVLLVLWFVAGRPAGAESIVLAATGRGLRQLASAARSRGAERSQSGDD
jgi:O-antigen/teichoic acid export membrane protein